MNDAAPQPTLFIADDDPGMLDFIARVGRLAGYRTVSFGSGDELLTQLDAAPDAIILDISMPGLDGIEVIQSLAERGYAGRLIIVSGFFGDVIHAAELLARGRKLDLAGTLTKPFLAAQLKALLARDILPLGS